MGVNDYQAYLDTLKSGAARSTSSALSLNPVNPDEAAEALSLSSELGVPQDMIGSSLPQWREEAKFRRNSTILTGAPKTQGWLSDFNNAALAKDDIDNLSWFEKSMLSYAEMGEAVTDSQFGRGVQTGATGAKQIGTALKSVPAQGNAAQNRRLLDLYEQVGDMDAALSVDELAAALDINPMSVEASFAHGFLTSNPGRREQYVETAVKTLAADDEIINETREAIEQFSADMQKTQGRTPNFSDIDDVGAFADWFAFNSGQSLPYLAITGLAGLLTGGAGVVGSGYLMGVGDINAEMLEQGITDQANNALVGAIPYAGLELLGPAARPFRNVGGNVLESVAEGYFKRAAKEVPANAVEEFINEAGQEIIKDLVVADAGGEEVTLDNETLLRWFDSGMAGAAGGASVSAVSTALTPRQNQINRDMQSAANAGTTAAAIDEIDRMAANSKLRERAPDKFAEALDAQGESDFYIAADDLREYFQAKDMEFDAETLEAWGIDPIDFRQAELHGGDVTIPRSAYATRISGGEDAAWFRDNATRETGEMSVSQAARANLEVRESLEKAFADAEDQRARDLEVRDSDVKVYDNVFSQLRAAGRTRDVADNEARVWSSFWRTMADRYGGDPLELAQSMGVQIVGPQTPDAARRRNDLDIKLNTLRSNPQRALRAEGTDLLDFVRSKGGISDTGGDVAAMDAPKGIISETREQAEARRGQPNMFGLSDSKGTGLDEIGRAAIEAGYFPELMGGSDVQADGTVVDEAAVLLEALQRAISGEAIYPVGEGPNQDMVDLSNELSRRGIDLAMSNDEIAAALEDQGGQAFDQGSSAIDFDSLTWGKVDGEEVVFDNDGDLSTELADLVFKAIPKTPHINLESGASNVSSSRYVNAEFSEIDEDGDVADQFGEFKLRFSDHDDRYGADKTIRYDEVAEGRYEDGDFVETRISKSDMLAMVSEGRAAILEAFSSEAEGVLPQGEIASVMQGDATGRQYDQSGKLITDTPEFRAWFGDSKVVDKNGDPLVVYHGRQSDFDTFDMKNGQSWLGGAYFTANRKEADFYAEVNAQDGDTPNVLEAYLSLQNPASRSDFDQIVSDFEAQGNDDYDITDELKSKGFDGYVGLNPDDDQGNVIVAFSPTQIKSVYNRGTFDRSDPRILFQDGGIVRRGINPSVLIFREEEQNRTDDVAEMFPDGEGYPPIVAAETEDGLLILDGHNRASVAIDRGDTIDVVVIPNDAYQSLLNDGFDEVDIAHGALDYAGEDEAAGQIRQQFSGVDFFSSSDNVADAIDNFRLAQEDRASINLPKNNGTFDANDPRILYQSAAQENPLVVVHNISERGLLIADELGGLAAPSLAVAGGNVGFDNFGDITLVASQDMANPKSRGVRTFASDVYSARQPRARYDLKKSGLDRIESALGPAAEKIGIDSIWQEISEDRMASGIENAMENSDAAKMAFLESIGKAPRVVKKKRPEFDPRLKPFAKADVRTLYDNPEFDALALEIAEERIAAVSNEKFRDRVESTLVVVEDGKRLPSYDMINDLAKRIEKNRAPEGIDRYETGRVIRARINQTKKRQGEFEAWIQNEFGDVLTNKHFETETGRRKPYEMAPLVREITRSLRDAEGYNYGSGSVRALVTPEFKSIDAIKDRRGKIISDEEMKALGDEANTELFALADKFSEYHGSGQEFGWGDIFSEFLKDLARGNLREWQNNIFDKRVPDNLISEARGFLGKLADMPTHYFEVKMQRAVGLGEFAAAVVPKSASAETVARLKDAGLRIVRYEKNNAQSRLEALQKAGSREFFQRYEASGKRGSIQLPSGGLKDGQTVINLFESANLSTFIHESGHFFLEAFTALATSDTAPQGMKDDLAAIRKFLKVDGTAPLTTAQHEMWARAFEAYAMEGKAPSLALADAFGRFKSWLTRIYKTALGLNVKITPEIREVMDRMLATDAEIAAAREMQQMSPLFTSEAAAGMTPAAWETYQKMARRSEEQASQALLEKTMAKVRREKETWWKDERADVKKEVTTTVDSKPEYRLIEMLANQKWIGSDDPVPDFQLDRTELVETFGDGVLAELSRSRFGGKRAIYGADGISLYEAAEFFGFANPTEMVETLQNTGKKKDAIELENDRIMADRYGDPLNDGSIEEEAVAAIHSDQQAQTVAAEARHLAGQAGKPTRNMTAKVFRQRARMMLSRMSVKDATRPNAFLEAERRSAKRAEDAFARTTKGRNAGESLAAAAKHKEQQMLNHYLYMESRDLTKMVASKREKMRNYSKASVREKLDGGYIEQIDALLEGYDFRVRSAGQIKRSEKLRAFVERMVEEGRKRDLDIDERLLDEANRKHYTKMSVDELQGLFDTIENIDHMGRHKQKLIDAKNKRELQEVADTFSTAISDRFGTGKAANQSKQVRNFFNLLFSVDTMMVDLDGTETGDVYDLFKAPLDRGQAQEQQMNVAMADAVQDIFSVYSSKELSQMQVQKLIPGGNGHTWSKMEIISLALNTGHQDGRNRILEDTVHPERRLTQDQLDALLDTLEKGDWDFVQSMLKQVNSYWPELAATHHRRTGTTLKKIDAVPIETKFGVYPGGYYPLAYDSQRSIGAAKDEASAWDKFNAAGRGSRIEVKSGMTIARKENSGGRTLDFDLNVALRHMRDTIRVITMSEVVDNAARIIKHKDVETAFMDAGQTNQFNTLKLFLDDLAVGPVYNTDPINSFARVVKNNFTMAKLAFNFKTVALQVTGITQSAVVVGKRNMVRGYRDYLANPNAAVQMAMEKSAFMSERKTSFQKDIYDQVNDIQLSSPLAKRGTKVKNAVGKAGFYPMIRVQFLTVDVPTWIAAHDAKLREGATDEAAVKYADRIVARSQGSGLYADRNALERGTVAQNMRQSDFIRLWTTLGSYMVTKMNRGYLAAQKGKRGISEADNVGEMAGSALNMASDLALLYMAEAIMMGLAYALLAGDDADEEDLTKFIMTNTATSVIGGVPIVSGVANAFQGYGAGGVLASVLEMPANVATQLRQGENDAALWRSISDAGGMLTGLPSTATYRAIEGIVRGADEGELPLADMFFGSNPLTR